MKSRRIMLLAGLGALLAAGRAVWAGVRYSHQARREQAEPPALSESYTHPTLGFSFRYPSNLKLNEIPHGEGSELILVEDPAQARHGFQVFSMSYDDSGPLTEARIKQDVPDITMSAGMRSTAHHSTVKLTMSASTTAHSPQPRFKHLPIHHPPNSAPNTPPQAPFPQALALPLMSYPPPPLFSSKPCATPHP